MANRKPEGEIAYGAETYEEMRDRILQDAGAAFRKEYEWFQGWFIGEYRRGIKSHWELGQRFLNIHNDATINGGQKYGLHAVEHIRDLFGWDEGAIYNSMKIAQKYTEDEINEICEMRMKNGQPLSYTHIICVSMVDDRAKRKELIDKAVAESWTTRQLTFAVAPDLKPKKPASDGRGRPLAVPKNFDAVLAQIDSFVNDFLDRAEKVWESPQHSLSAKAADLGPDDITDAIVAKVKAVADKLLKLSQKAELLEEKALAVHQGFLKVLSQKKPALKVIGAK